MTKVVDLQTYRDHVFKQKSFGPWQKRFGESYNIATRLSDLSDHTLYFLAQPGDNSSVAFYELIMGILDLGPATAFNTLPNQDQMRVVDVHLFLADQVRFEIMRRLKWLVNLPGEKHGLVEMVQNFDQYKATYRDNPPDLTATHPDYTAYEHLSRGDKEVFIRRLLRDALDTFNARLGPQT